MIPAHLSLFNQLSPEIPGLIHDLRDACAGQSPIPGTFDGLRFLGKGVAYTLSAPRLNTFREDLKQRWNNWLEPQDLQRLSPHVTVQNKVDPQTARALHVHLSSTFEPIGTVIEGVSLWRYLDGPWEHLLDLHFYG